jgi:hypothetical protein
MTITADQIRLRLGQLGYICADSADEAAVAAEEGLLDYLIERAGQEILDYTHLDEVPAGLQYAWVDLVCGSFLGEKKAGGGNVPGFDVETAAKRITEGDTTVEYALGSGDLTPEARLDALIRDLTDIHWRLNPYRRLSW